MLQLDYIPDLHGIIFPANPYPRQIFYRDDLNQLFWWNGAAWIAAGGVVLPHHPTHELGGADQVMGTVPATPLALIHRDAAGRAQIANPAANPDIDNLGARDAAIAIEAAARAAADAAEAATRAAADAAHAGLTTGVHGLDGRRNAIINGWAIVDQRAADYTLIKDIYGIRADRWYGMATGTAVSAGILTKTTAANCGKTGHAFKFSGVTLTGTGIIYFRYRMEAKDAVQFKNQTASFRCQVYQDTGGAINYTIFIRKANAADDFSAVTAISNSGAISVPNTIETSLPYLAIAMGDCSNGIEIEIKVACGAITTKNFEFTELQFELGSVATPFEFRHLEQELILCQRYYEKSYPYDVVPGTNTVGSSLGANSHAYHANYATGWGFITPKRTAPTIYLWSRIGTSAKVSRAADAVNFGTIVSWLHCPDNGGGFLYDSGGGFTIGETYDWHYVAVAEL